MRVFPVAIRSTIRHHFTNRKASTNYAFRSLAVVTAAATLATAATCSFLAADAPPYTNENEKSRISGKVESSSEHTTETEDSANPVTSYLPSLPSLSIPLDFLQWSWPASLLDLQAKVATLLAEVSGGPGSLYSQVNNDPPNMTTNPECSWDAYVRISDDLPLAEKAFLRERRRKIKPHLARFIGVDEDEINELDVPIVAIAGSGGGYRAMMNTVGSLIGAETTGLWDCTTYIAGISGSCWALGTMYSGVFGSSSPQVVGQGLKENISKSYLDTDILDPLIDSRSSRYFLSGLLRKLASSSLCLTDLYGTLISARLFVSSRSNFLYDSRQLSLAQFAKDVSKGSAPLPIFTAVCHDIPVQKQQQLQEVADALLFSVDKRSDDLLKEEVDAINDASDWLWFEFTPFEIGCDALGAYIPSWASGRAFKRGKNIERLPEMSFTIQSGIFASAFCATMHQYIREVQPLLRILPNQLSTWIEDILTRNEKEMHSLHPIVPDEIPNYVYGMHGQLKQDSNPELTSKKTLGLMDAGAVLNIPYYPLLRREVDCIIALDASADSQDLWFTRAEAYAAKRGLKSWPKGVRWPVEVEPGEEPQEGGSSDDKSVTQKLAAVQEREISAQVEKEATNPSGSSPQTDLRKNAQSSLSHVWIGTSKGSNDTSGALESGVTETELSERDGIGIVYIPLIANESVVSGFDPFDVSTWRRELTLDESQNLLRLSKMNFVESNDSMRKVLRAMWLRKKRAREGN